MTNKPQRLAIIPNLFEKTTDFIKFMVIFAFSLHQQKILSTMMTSFSNIALLVAALLGLCAMLRWDLQLMQQIGYSNSRYNTWLKQTGELTSLKRILVLAVLVGTFTSMALGSWMVIMVLAGVLAILAFTMLFRRLDRPLILSGRAVRLYAVTLLLGLLLVAAVFIIGDRMGLAEITRTASTVAIIILAFSPLLMMVANWILHPFERHPDYGHIEKKGKN